MRGVILLEIVSGVVPRLGWSLFLFFDFNTSMIRLLKLAHTWYSLSSFLLSGSFVVPTLLSVIYIDNTDDRNLLVSEPEKVSASLLCHTCHKLFDHMIPMPYFIGQSLSCYISNMHSYDHLYN